MKSINTSILLLLALQLALVLSSPTKTLEKIPRNRVGRAVYATGDTTTVSLSATETWTLEVTLQNGSDADYDDDELRDTNSAFNTAVANAPTATSKVTATRTDAVGNGYELDLDLDSGITIGSKTNAYWGVAGNIFLSWTQYQEYPQKFTAKCTDNNGTELGYYEYTFTAK